MVGGSNARQSSQYDIFFYTITSGYNRYSLSTLTSANTHGARGATFGDGGVLVTGGSNGDNGGISNQAVYYASSSETSAHTKSTLTNLETARYSHGASHFGDGGILVYGGRDEGHFNFQPEYYANTSHTRSTLDKGDTMATSDLGVETFGNGAVGCFGGNGYGSGFQDTVFIYANTSHTMSATATMTTVRESGNNIAAMFTDGGVGVFGGWIAGGGVYTANVDYFASGSYTRSSLTALSSARGYGPACRFGDGGCALFGGFKGSQHSLEVDYYANSSHSKSALTALTEYHTDGGAAMMNHGDDKGAVYVSGGYLNNDNNKSIEKYLTTSHTRSTVEASFQDWAYAAMETFGNGDIIIAGGRAAGSTLRNTAFCLTNRRALALPDGQSTSTTKKYKFNEHSSEASTTAAVIRPNSPNSGYVKVINNNKITIS